jgi:hypothetical protein
MFVSFDKVVGIVARLGTGQTRARDRTNKDSHFDWRKERYFALLQTTRTGSGAKSLFLPWVPVAIASGVKGPDCKAHQLPPSSAVFKNNWSCTYSPHHAFIVCIMTNLPLPYPNFIIL